MDAKQGIISVNSLNLSFITTEQLPVMTLCTGILLFCYNTKIQKALSTQEPNLWGGGNSCVPFFCLATLLFSSSRLPVKYFDVSTYYYA